MVAHGEELSIVLPLAWLMLNSQSTIAPPMMGASNLVIFTVNSEVFALGETFARNVEYLNIIIWTPMEWCLTYRFKLLKRTFIAKHWKPCWKLSDLTTGLSICSLRSWLAQLEGFSQGSSGHPHLQVIHPKKELRHLQWYSWWYCLSPPTFSSATSAVMGRKSNLPQEFPFKISLSDCSRLSVRSACNNLGVLPGWKFGFYVSL